MTDANNNDNNDTSYFIPRNANVGDQPNERVKFCRTCEARGWPHEAISFRTINDGRLKGDDSYEFKTYQILNYTDDTPHDHKPYRRSVQ